MNKNKGINNLLKYILLLQNNSINNSSNTNTYNTRVIEIYSNNGNIINTDNTTYYRIQNINNNCITLLLLENSNNKYKSLNKYITISINSISAIRCIEDIILNL